jgi:hypothetical protein
MKSKIQPAVMKMFFPISDRGETIPQNTVKTLFIDLSQCASIMNRRFYRQGLNWAVGSFELHTPVESSIMIQKIPNTWVTSNAWEKGFRAWMKMNKEALDEADSIKPKFLDFKIYADKNHHRLGFDANILPYSVDVDDSTQTTTITDAVAGEWVSSKFVVPDTADGAVGGIENREVIMVGGNYPGSGASGLGAVSLINGYANSRALPDVTDPNIPGDSMDATSGAPENWLSALFNEGSQQDSQVLSDMVENNQAPYPYENDGIHTDTMYPGGETQLPDLEIHSLDTVTTTTIGGMTHIQGGNFPCGLIAIHYTPTGNAATAGLHVNLVPGNHRGYLAEPMTDM